MNLSALTNGELEGIRDAFDALIGAYELLFELGVIHDGIEYGIDDLADAVAEELDLRNVEDAAFRRLS